MKIIFTGDFQARVDNLDRCQQVVNQIVRLLRSWKNEERAVVFLGDIKDAFNPCDIRVTNFILGMAQQITAEAPLYFIRGNHDSITTQDGVPSCVPIVEAGGSSENFSTLTADQDWERFELPGGGLLWGVPYFRDPVRQREAFVEAAADARSYSSKVRKILAFHNEVSGCQRSVFSKGEGISLRDMDSDAYDLCVSGHIHHPQIVFKPSGGPGGTNGPVTPLRRSLGAKNEEETAFLSPPGGVIYAGSPFPTDWGEVNSEKSLLVAALDRCKPLSLKRIPSVVPNWYDPDAPSFRPPKSWKGVRVRVRVPVACDAPTEIQAVRSRLEKKYSGANLVLVPEVQNSAPVESLDTTGGDGAILRRYLEKIEIPEGVTVEQMETFVRKYLPLSGVFGIQGIKFGKTAATNVLCFEKAEIDFDRQGLTLVTGTNHDWPGSNGSGKSSLVTLPFLALFGRTFKGQTFDGWARQGVKDGAGVGLYLTLADGRKLHVVRGRRPNNFRAYLDGAEITMGDVNATQAAIERLTNLTWSVLTNAVYVGQREIGSVFGTEKERKELFSRLLGLERFIEASDKIRKVLLRCKRSVEEVESDISYSESALIEASSGIEDVAKALMESKVPSNTERALLEEDLLTCNHNLETLKARQKAADEWMDVNQKAFEKLLFKATDLEVRCNHLSERRKALQGLKGDCPTCGTRIDVSRLEKSAQQLSTQIDALETEWSRYDERQRENREERRKKFEEFQSIKKQIAAMTQLQAKFLQEQARMQEQIDACQRLEKILASKRARVKVLQKTKSVHERAHLACVQEQQFVEACLSAVGRDGLPAYLAAIAAPALNRAASRYSEIFSDGKIGVSFEIAGGEIDVRIRNDAGGADFKDQSAGESRMAGIIAAFAFRETMVPHNLLVLDEPGAGLDAGNAAAFAKGLSKTVERFQHVVIISHDPYILGELEPNFHWEVEKQNGVATVKEI